MTDKWIHCKNCHGTGREELDFGPNLRSSVCSCCDGEGKLYTSGKVEEIRQLVDKPIPCIITKRLAKVLIDVIDMLCTKLDEAEQREASLEEKLSKCIWFSPDEHGICWAVRMPRNGDMLPDAPTREEQHKKVLRMFCEMTNDECNALYLLAKGVVPVEVNEIRRFIARELPLLRNSGEFVNTTKTCPCTTGAVHAAWNCPTCNGSGLVKNSSI